MAFLRLLLSVFVAGTVFFREMRNAIMSLISLKKHIQPNRYHTVEPMKGTVMSMIADQLQIERGTYDPEHDQMLIDIQKSIEELFHKNQLLPRLVEAFVISKTPFTKAMDDALVPHKFGFTLLAQMALHKRATVETLVGVLRYLCKGDCQATANMIQRCVDARLVDWNRQLQKFTIIWDISDELQKELDTYQHPLPMIILPRPVNSNQDTGYITMSDSIILRNYHTDDVVLDHINRVNAVPLTLNHKVAQMVKNRWRNLDKPKKGEDREEYLARVKAFNKYDRTCKDVFTHLAVASDVFYLTHRYDKRGRTYCVGYHVNYQGNGWNKAMVNFAEKEVTTNTIKE
jgi:hypothetical protein